MPRSKWDWSALQILITTHFFMTYKESSASHKSKEKTSKLESEDSSERTNANHTSWGIIRGFVSLENSDIKHGFFLRYFDKISQNLRRGKEAFAVIGSDTTS